MLSICIPVYNVDVTNLVTKLILQGQLQPVTTEILIYDDGSNMNYKNINRTLQDYKQVKYKELEINHGSAAIRNKMAADAIYDYLLFIDSDSEIPTDYLSKYIPFIKSNKPIVCGGRIHPEKLPSMDKSLRWKVGKIREDFSAQERNKIPNKSFMSNNFLINKELYQKTQFDESIKRSGHEDTMFGIKLELMGVDIFHINNPVTHIGLEKNMEFIIKTKQRLDTLKIIEHRNTDNNLLYQRITILRYYKILKQFKLIGLTGLLFNISKNLLDKLLLQSNPSMFVYDIYKLGYYSLISKQ